MRRVIITMLILILGICIGYAGTYIVSAKFFRSYADKELIMKPIWQSLDTGNYVCDNPDLNTRWWDISDGLVKRLSDPNPKVRSNSTILLGYWATTSSIPDKLLPLINDSDPEVRLWALVSLAQWGCPQAMQVMIDRIPVDAPGQVSRVVGQLEHLCPDGPVQVSPKRTEVTVAEWKKWLNDNLLYLECYRGKYSVNKEAQEHKVPVVFWTLIKPEVKSKWDHFTDSEKTQAILDAAYRRAAINANRAGEGLNAYIQDK